MHTEKKSHQSRMDPIVALVLIFAVLKVTGLISWSWLWVFSPIWITLCFHCYFSSIWSVDESLKESGNFQFAVFVLGRVWGGTAFAKRSAAMKAPVGL